MTFPCKIVQMMLKLHRHSLGMHFISRSPIMANRIHATSVLLILHFVLSSAQLQPAPGSPQIPAIFAFGDSLIDSGNNNYLASVAKSNYWPYGCDFNRGPTGRFSNGKTIVDLLGEKVGIPDLPAFADPTTVGAKILQGVNYASAGAGILDETGRHWGDRISLSQQVINFESTLDGLKSMIGASNISHYLARSIVIVSFGSNDYINNYLMPSVYDSSYKYRPPEFANLLLNRYTLQLLALYNLGLRKFFMVGVGPLGCIPNQRAGGQAPQDRCADSVNQILGPYNEGLRSLVAQLNADHPAALFAYANAYVFLGDILNNPAYFGFTVLDRACCGLGPVTCMPNTMPCGERNQHVFWDAYHPTEAVNSILAHRAFTGPPSDCYPVNFQQLTLI